MPGRSGHDSVKMYSSSLAILTAFDDFFAPERCGEFEKDLVPNCVRGLEEEARCGRGKKFSVGSVVLEQREKDLA